MKKILLSGVFLLAALLTVLFVNFTVSDKNEVTAAEEKNKTGEVKEEKRSCCSEDEGSSGYSENSIYQLESVWTDQNGMKKELSDFAGKPTVMTMFFASCTYACPILVQDMKRIESQIPEGQLKNYNFVLVSIDPERDTPAKLKEFARVRNLDEKRWTLLTSNENNVMELAALTGFKFRKEKDGQFSHSNIINILGEEGEIIHQHLGLNQDITLAANYLTNEQE